jgi:hypothetical protein
MHKAAQACLAHLVRNDLLREIEAQAPLIDIDCNLAAGLSSVFTRGPKLTGR